MRAFKTGGRLAVKRMPAGPARRIVVVPSPACPELQLSMQTPENIQKTWRLRGHGTRPYSCNAKRTVFTPVALMGGSSYRTVADEIIVSSAGQRRSASTEMIRLGGAERRPLRSDAQRRRSGGRALFPGRSSFRPAPLRIAHADTFNGRLIPLELGSTVLL